MSLRTVLIIDDRKLKQMTKDLVMHVDLFAIENLKIKRLDYTTILYKNKDLISEVFLSILFPSPMFRPSNSIRLQLQNKWYVIESTQFLR